MVRKVLKYAFGTNTVMDIRQGKVVLVMAQQPGDMTPTLWLEHNEEDMDNQNDERDRYVIYGTGHPIQPDMEHVGSAVCNLGGLVWHIYKQVK